MYVNELVARTDPRPFQPTFTPPPPPLSHTRFFNPHVGYMKQAVDIYSCNTDRHLLHYFITHLLTSRRRLPALSNLPHPPNFSVIPSSCSVSAPAQLSIGISFTLSLPSTKRRARVTKEGNYETAAKGDTSFCDMDNVAANAGAQVGHFPLEQWFYEMPVCTRWWTAATVATSLAVQTQIITPFQLFYSWRAVFVKSQVCPSASLP